MNKLLSYIFLVLLFKTAASGAEIRLRSTDSLKSDITVQQGDLIRKLNKGIRKLNKETK